MTKITDVPEFRTIIGEDLAEKFTNASGASDAKAALRKCFTALMTSDREKVKAQIEKLTNRLKNMGEYCHVTLSK